jgi:hypothetical protein
MIEVPGEGIAESSAGGCEVVAGEGGGVGGRHDARVADSGDAAGSLARRIVITGETS